MKVIPLVVAGLTLAAVLVRWRRMSKPVRAVALALATGLVAYGTGAVRPPNVEGAVRQLGESLGSYTYLFVGVMAFLETGAGIGLVAPGELAVIIGGVTAGQGHTDIALLILLVWLCALAGDMTSYLLGRRLGRDFIRKHGQRVKLTPARIEQVERFFALHGGKTILVGRFIGLVRTLAPFIAGASKMAPKRFIAFDVPAAGAWSASCCLLGYAFWQSLDRAAAIARQGTVALILVTALLAAMIMGVRYLRVPANRKRARGWAQRCLQRPSRAVRLPMAYVRRRKSAELRQSDHDEGSRSEPLGSARRVSVVEHQCVAVKIFEEGHVANPSVQRFPAE